MRKRGSAIRRVAVATSALLVLLSAIPMTAARRSSRKKDASAKGEVVYVCSCMKNRSCSCMTEAKTEGPCSCGTGGGPPMKAVPSHSAWAKNNRSALAK